LRTSLEVADIFRAEGASYRTAQAGHLSLTQLKVMSAIETCRTAALGGHLDACEDCGHQRIAYNSCRNRHCPCTPGAAARTWLAERESDLLPVGYFHVVFTLPTEVADIAWQNKAVVYDLLFRAAAETMMTIAADLRHLGARIGITAVLHTWGSAMTHHPHIHRILPGGGISLDSQHWISSRPAFLLPVRMLGSLFRRLFLTQLIEWHRTGQLAFSSPTRASLADHRLFLRHLAAVRNKRWVVYAKPPFTGPEAVLAYLSRYTHRVAISNRRLLAFDAAGVTFRYKDYRRDGADRQRVMTLGTDEFIRRFLLHLLPPGFHRIRHFRLVHLRRPKLFRLSDRLNSRKRSAAVSISPWHTPEMAAGHCPVVSSASLRTKYAEKSQNWHHKQNYPQRNERCPEQAMQKSPAHAFDLQ